MGRNIEDFQIKNSKGRCNQIRPKSEKIRTVAVTKASEPSATNFIQKNLDNYIFKLTNFELKQKLESCPGNIGDCPVLNDFREGLKKSISNHVNVAFKNKGRVCKTSRVQPKKENQCENAKKENLKMSKPKSNESTEKTQSVKEVKATTSKGLIRSTRAQDLRSQSNRDLLKPKTTSEKTRTASPYITVLPQKKKKCLTSGSLETKSANQINTSKTVEDKKKQTKVVNKNEKNAKLPYKAKTKKEKSSSAGEEISLQRQKTQDIINPKIVKKNSAQKTIETAAGDCGFPQLKKSQTFFICKGAKNGEGDDKSGDQAGPSSWNAQPECLSDGNVTDDDATFPEPKPLTHNDSFCLIVKSSQNWSQKNRSDDEKWLHYGLAYKEKSKKSNDKGILKNSNHDLKSVDSLEIVESEKIVRFSDEQLRNKRVLKKLVRRKKRLQNLFTPAWYQKNKLFQKYLQILREKSVLLSERSNTPEDLKPFRVPTHVKERYEAEMFGLYPRRVKVIKHHPKEAYSY